MPFNSETAKRAKSLQAGRGENKVNRLVKDVVSDVFNSLQTTQEAKDKKADLKSWALANPKDFYLIASKLIPVQMQHAGQVIQRLIIEDNSNCNPLILPDESNPGIQS